MKKHLRKTLVAAAVVGAVASGIPGTASAYVYGLSHLEVQNFFITFSPLGPTTTVTSYTFTETNTAVLNGTAVITTASCNGTQTTTTCGAGPVLDPLAAQVGTPTGENNFGFVGTGVEYARADSIITTAQLVNGFPSAVNLIAENNLITGLNASDSAQLQSTTNLNFSAGAGTSLTLTFIADVDQRVAIIDTGGSSQSNTQTTFRLTRTSAGGGFISWTPDGVIVAGDCSVSAGLTGASCSELNDGDGVVGGEDSLNNTIATGLNPSNITYSYDVGQVFNPYGISITGLPAGDYSLSLSGVVSDDKFRIPSVVPEPASLSLLGLALLAMGFSTRRRSRNA